LVETDEGLERRDFCRDYWQQSKPEVYCHWRTKLADEQKKRIFIDDDMLLAFFDRLGSETQQEKINFRFVVTLILMRKKLLKYDSSRIEDNGREIWVLKKRRSDELAEVANPHLSEEQIEELSGQLGQILQVDL
jgi:hypothetical protein